MRTRAEILHLDLDAFFAAVEQRDKPSLLGRPVVVGGVGGRGVVATASYEARAYGVRSAMPVSQARRRCPHAAYLVPRFAAYRTASQQVMAELHAVCGLVEQVSIDEAYADLAVAAEVDEAPARRAAGADGAAPGAGGPGAGGPGAGGPGDPAQVAAALRQRVYQVTGGLVASIGVAPSKSVAKLASEAAKPDGLLVLEPADVRGFLDPLPVLALGGVGPATAARLRTAGISTVAHLAAMDERDAVVLLGSAHGRGLLALARGQDDRPVVAWRETKSVSVEETFGQDLRDPVAMAAEVDLLAARVAARLRPHGWAGRTVTLKVRFADFTARTRSHTYPAALDDGPGIARAARALLGEIDTLEWSTAGGVRLLGVGVSGLADWVQPDLLTFMDDPAAVPAADRADPAADRADPAADRADEAADPAADRADPAADPAASPDLARPVGDPGDPGDPAVAVEPTREWLPAGPVGWRPGADVRHTEHGPGWVWGSGLGRVTVRFEGPGTPAGPVRTFAATDPDLTPADPPVTEPAVPPLTP